LLVGLVKHWMKGKRMRNTTYLLSLITITALFGTLGCSTFHKSDSATLQGTWKGHQIGADPQGPPAAFVITGKAFEFRGANPNEWYKGTFSLREDTHPRQFIAGITECAAPQYAGKTSLAIYKIEGDTLTIAATEPSSLTVPMGFDAPGIRGFALEKE
jgi:uncharacterized protein (TIGR03067 family)